MKYNNNNYENTLKNHENQSETTKNHKNTLKIPRKIMKTKTNAKFIILVNLI